MVGYAYPRLNFMNQILLKDEYPTEADFKEIEYTSKDTEGNTTYLVTEDNLKDDETLEEIQEIKSNN